MALEIKLNQKLSQSLIMTPQLQQAIKLLQLGRIEYLEVLQKELLENPVLEDERFLGDDEAVASGTVESQAPEVNGGISESAPAESGELESITSMESIGTMGETREESLDDQLFNSVDQKDRSIFDPDADWRDYFDTYTEAFHSGSTTAGRYAEEEDRSSIEASFSKPEGLATYLLNQLRTSDLPVDDRDIALFVIGNLDRGGYLRVTIEEVATACRKPVEDAERVLKLIQSFDPPGVASRDLRECLLNQLEHSGHGESLAKRIVEFHLDKLELRRYDLIAREENVPLSDVYEAVREIQRLEPRPGRQFIDEPPIYVTPDIYVRKIGDDYVISLNETGMPRLRLNPKYRELLINGKTEELPNKEYLQDRLRSAAWLIKSIHQRQQTIYRVTESIMKFQREFLDQGVSSLKPLVLRDVAGDVGMHESTVSRVTTNKYVHTPQGIFELKFFFSSGLKSGAGEISSESVKERIRALVMAENPRRPLSDRAIVEQLRREGVDIARRTVAKYREMLNILSSSRRKKVF